MEYAKMKKSEIIAMIESGKLIEKKEKVAAPDFKGCFINYLKDLARKTDSGALKAAIDIINSKKSPRDLGNYPAFTIRLICALSIDDFKFLKTFMQEEKGASYYFSSLIKAINDRDAAVKKVPEKTIEAKGNLD